MILTTKGWKKHGDLEYGDYVFSDKGKKVKVLGNTGAYDFETGKMIFANGEQKRCSINHLWKVIFSSNNNKKTARISEARDIFYKEHKRRPYIEVAKPLECSEKKLPIDPYILGIWLGDGNSRMGKTTVGKEDIDFFKQFGKYKEVKPGCYEVLIKGLSALIRENDLRLNKHIPVEYFTASIEQRRELLYGLMDTDGTVSENGCNIEFTQMKGQLALDFVTLANSLGMKARYKEYPAKLYGRVVGIKSRIFLTPNKGERFFRLERKQKRIDKKIKKDRADKYKFFIKDFIEDKKIEKVNCIQVEGGMYLSGRELIPTHNSELSTRRLPSLLLGRNPKLRIAVICYNATIARGFNKNVQDIIIGDSYRALFPKTIIKGVSDKDSLDELKKKGRELEKNSYMFETTEGGYLISTGVNGSLTSKTVDVLIMDDLYKGKMDAYSPVFRQRVSDFYSTVADTRLHNKSKQLILFTRWHEEDLAGVLLKKEKELWKVAKYEALKVHDNNSRDKRETGEALWPEIHSKEKLLRFRKNDPNMFEALMQQNPRPVEGLLYSKLKVYKEIPEYGIIKNYTDTADEGKDFLGSISYLEDQQGYCYILDIIYTQKTMEYTEPLVARTLDEYNVNVANIESNNGGKGFARNVAANLKKYELNSTKIRWFHQSKNKEARILSNSTSVMKYILFPEGWEEKYPEAYDSMAGFLADIKANDHDDLQDVLTGIIEMRSNRKKRSSRRM